MWMRSKSRQTTRHSSRHQAGRVRIHIEQKKRQRRAAAQGSTLLATAGWLPQGAN
eukprot:COSAG06_NODE_2126_length_7537_cov_9.348077_4_plen_55_part_00